MVAGARTPSGKSRQTVPQLISRRSGGSVVTPPGTREANGECENRHGDNMPISNQSRIDPVHFGTIVVVDGIERIGLAQVGLQIALFLFARNVDNGDL